jgi:hypothetical protein
MLLILKHLMDAKFGGEHLGYNAVALKKIAKESLLLSHRLLNFL